MSLSRGKVRIARLAPIAVVAAAGAALLTVSGVAQAAVAGGATAARGAWVAGTAARAAAVNPFTCAANPLRITAKGKPGPNLAKPCRNDTVGGAQSAGTVGAVQVSATGVSGTTAVGGGARALEA